ncbi:putative DNA helicase [Helianthus annuus]|nr:putative DNA helicase [Helianthus annuus]
MKQNTRLYTTDSSHILLHTFHTSKPSSTTPPLTSTTMATSISQFIHNHPNNNNTHTVYRLTFFNHTIETLVTDTPSYVDTWISTIHHTHRHHLHSLIVGLDVEWRPNQTPNHQNPIATLQLCVGNHCLIFQILNSPSIPQSLINFLGNPSYTFVGVGIENDVEKLGLVVAKRVDLRSVAAYAYGGMEFKNAGLKQLASMVLGWEINKPKEVTMSGWDNKCLTPVQVQYAAIDAFVSFEIGRVLISGNRY